MICTECWHEDYDKTRCKSVTHYNRDYAAKVRRPSEKRRKHRAVAVIPMPTDGPLTTHQQAATIVVQAGMLRRLIQVMDRLGEPQWPALSDRESVCEDKNLLYAAWPGDDDKQSAERLKKIRRKTLSDLSAALDDLIDEGIMMSVPLFVAAVRGRSWN